MSTKTKGTHASCKVCGVEFTRTANNQKYCSKACCNKYWGAPLSGHAAKSCIQCGNEFSGPNKKKYCSPSCRINYRIIMAREEYRVARADNKKCREDRKSADAKLIAEYLERRNEAKVISEKDPAVKARHIRNLENMARSFR